MTLEQWLMSLVPTFITALVIVMKLGRVLQKQDDSEKRLDKLLEVMPSKEVFDAQLKSIDSRVEQLDGRVDRMEKRVFNGSGH